MLIPCTLVRPAHDVIASIVIAAHPQGKSACYAEPIAGQVLADGKALCLVDLRHLGETAWDHPDALLRNVARAELWLGRTMIGNWVKDLRAVSGALKEQGFTQSVELLGFEEPAIATLAAAALGTQFTGVGVVNLLSTYVVTEVAPVQSYSLFLPGFLRWGDVSLMAALTGGAVRVHSLVHASGEPLSLDEHAAWMREVEQFARGLKENELPSSDARKAIEV